MADERDAKLDAMIAETESLISQARDLAQQLESYLKSIGHPGGNALQDLVNASSTDDECRSLVSEELAAFQRELDDENKKQTSGSSSPSRPMNTSKI